VVSRRPQTERLLLDPSTIGVREVLLVGRYHYTAAHPPLLAHAHEGVLEVCYLERGRQVYAFAGDALHLLRGGEVLVAQPEEVHGTGHFPEFPGDLYWLQVKMPRTGETLLGLRAAESAAVVAALAALPRQFRGASELRNDFEALLVPVAMSSELRAVAFRTQVLRLLLRCIEIAARRGGRESLPHPIARALDAISTSALSRVKVAEMAKAGNLSESYFKALFRDAMGVPPAEFLRLLRLEHAQLQLRNTDASITQVAIETGFSSSQHFASAFRQQFGCTPRAFRSRGANHARETKSRKGAGIAFHPTADDE